MEGGRRAYKENNEGKGSKPCVKSRRQEEEDRLKVMG